MTYDRTGGLAAILAHPADEAFTCAGSMALARDAGETTRLLIVTRGEAGNAERAPDAQLAAVRESEMIRAAEAIGLNEVTLLDGYPDGAVASQPQERLVSEIVAWLGNRRPDVVITFGAHGVTGDPDHIAVGSAARWAVERLAREGVAPNGVFVIAPGFAPGPNRYDLSPEEQGATHRINITNVADRRLAALESHASQDDTADAIADLRAAIEGGKPIYEAFTRVRPEVLAPHPKFDTSLF
ncbi:MAG: PIG-L deacetylase family protein [Candidatus Limnocylindria bacterium]